MIACKTIIGFGFPTKAGTQKAHSDAPGEEEIAGARKILGWDAPPFVIPEPLLQEWRELGAKGRSARMAWVDRVKKAPAEPRSEFERRNDGKLPADWKKAIAAARAEFIASGKEMATRSASGAVLDHLAAAIPELLGGSADLTPSNNTKAKGHDRDQARRIRRHLHAQPMPLLRREPDNENKSARGGYVLLEAEGRERKLTILSTGSELHLAVEARDLLQKEGIPTAVVSMPCRLLFEQQDAAYKKTVLGTTRARVAVEAAVELGWERYIGFEGRFVGMHSFGASGKIADVYKKFDINAEAVVRAAHETLAEVAAL
jgi:transketolase